MMQDCNTSVCDQYNENVFVEIACMEMSLLLIFYTHIKLLFCKVLFNGL